MPDSDAIPVGQLSCRRGLYGTRFVKGLATGVGAMSVALLSRLFSFPSVTTEFSIKLRVPPVGRDTDAFSGFLAAVLVLPGIFYALGVASVLAAPTDFKTNFDTSAFSSNGSYDAGNGGCTFETCAPQSTFGNGDPTPFYQQVININGTDYFHVLVGDPATGFAQESYTRFIPGTVSGARGTQGGTTNAELRGASSPDGAGNETTIIGNPPGPGSCTVCNQTYVDTSLNMANPFAQAPVSGTGSQDPSRSVFRMVLTSAAGDMSLEVSKPFLDKKPIISQTVQSGTMSSVFVTDMSKLSYSEANDPAPVVNRLVLQDATIPGNGAANFDMASVQHSDVTAGRYTFTPGSGWTNPLNDPSLGWSTDDSSFGLGTYSYAGGPGFDPFTADWSTYFHYDQNALACEKGGAQSRVLLPGDTGIVGDGACPGHP